MATLLEDLINHINPITDRKGENHFTCPSCGHDSEPRRPHCSFNAKGWHCFACGAGGGLKDLAQRINLEADKIYDPPPQRPEKAKKTIAAPWRKYSSQLLQVYTERKDRFDLWKDYKPISWEAVYDNKLGVGILPGSACRHERLIVPIFDHAGSLIGLRGRRLACDCANWMVAPGTTLDMLPLYNERALRFDQAIFIVENPIDALWFTEVYFKLNIAAVAIYSTSYWHENWTQKLKALHPELVVVTLDNDLVGNGGGKRRPEFLAEWMKTHNVEPKARGPVIANILNKAGVPVILFDWEKYPYKADVGSVLSAKVKL